MESDEMLSPAIKAKLDAVEVDIRQTQAGLDRLERNEWWRWFIAFIIMLALVFGLFVLSMSIGVKLDWEEQERLRACLRGLLGLVLLFSVFVVHQQRLISKLRGDLALHLRVVTTLEALKAADDDPSGLGMERRRIRRFCLDRLVRVTTTRHGKPTTFLGRMRDISESGMGVVIPGLLLIREQVTLQFYLEEGREDTVSAIVRHRKGFLCGFGFVTVDASLREGITKIVEPAALSRR